MPWPLTPSKPGKFQFDVLPFPGGGEIALASCPGRHLPEAKRADWQRDLDEDLDVLADWGAAIVISLMETTELEVFQVSGISEALRARGLDWIHLPILDMAAPDQRFEQSWPGVSARIFSLLAGEGRLVLHCLGGLGRTGTVAARLLIEAGVSPPEAVTRIRGCRPGSIQTEEQLDYVLALVDKQ